MTDQSNQSLWWPGKQNKYTLNCIYTINYTFLSYYLLSIAN